MASLIERREFLQPLVEQWLGKIALAKKAKEPFDAIAQQCESFFSGPSGFMWKQEFREKYLGKSVQRPQFEVTINKAFELVEIIGPYLFWRYPQRYVTTEQPVEFSPEAFLAPEIAGPLMEAAGIPFTGEVDPELAEQFHQQVSSEQQREEAVRTLRNALMQRALNYTPREQPGGGLAVHGELAIKEALVKGRGLLWPEAYKFPGSDRNLTRLSYGSVDYYYVDPDASDPLLADAMFIVREHNDPYWFVEEKFKLRKDSLKERGNFESAGSMASRTSADDRIARRHGQTFDLVRWYEIWSKGGVGSRMKGFSTSLHDAFDEVVGDYAYLCVTRNVPWPLNAPSSRMRKWSSERVADAFRWPFPSYLDGRWPVALLDFNRTPNSAWPIAPLAPGLGELICMNIILSAYLEQAYENRKSIIAVAKSAFKDLSVHLRGSQSPAIVELNESIHKNINEAIQILNRPEMNNNLLEALNVLSSMFDKRTGLSEVLYAMNVGGVQERTAKGAAVKEEKASIRPDKMAKDVAAWMTEGANLEKFLLGWTVEGKDLAPLLGRWGAYFWDQLIVAEDPEVFVREMKATVEASDIRKPNKERLASNMQQMMQFLLPVYQQYAEATGDTRPINEFIETLGESLEQDTRDWALGDWSAQPDPAMAAMEQAQMQLEQAKLEAEVQGKQIDAQKSQIEFEKARIDAEAAAGAAGIELQQKTLEFVTDAAKHEQELEQDDERFEQEMEQDRAKATLDILQKRREGLLKLQQQRETGEVKIDQAKRMPRKPASSNGSSKA